MRPARSGTASAPASTAPHNWQFPQGGVDKGEDLETAALRELHEETGVSSAILLGRTEGWIVYDFPADRWPASQERASGWNGQKQVWFAFRFTGEDAEIDLEPARARSSSTPGAGATCPRPAT